MTPLSNTIEDVWYVMPYVLSAKGSEGYLVLPLVRNMVLPRLKSRLPSSLKTGFDVVMRLKT